MTLLYLLRQHQNQRDRVKLPLRLVLTLPFVILTVGTTGLVGYLCIRNGQKAVADLAHQLMTETGDRVNLYLNDYLETPQRVNRLNANAARLGQIDITDPESLERHFVQQIQAFDAVSRIHFSNPQGGFVSAGSDDRGLSVATTPNFVKGTLRVDSVDQQGNRRELLVERPNYDASQRPFYQRAVEANKPVWTPIYVYVPASRGLGISASYPLYDSLRRFQGVFSSDLTLVAIHQFLEKLRIGTNGTVFIVDRAGLMVASSTEEKPFSTPINSKETEQLKAIDSQQPAIRLSTQYLITQFRDLHKINTAAQLQFDIEGKPQFLQVTPFQDDFGLDWLIVVTVPEADFMGRIHANTQNTIILSAAALTGAVLLGLLLAHWIARPIQRLSQANHALAAGVWQDSLPENSPIAELQVLLQAFNQTAGQLQQTFDRVSTALQASEEKFATIFRTCPDPIGIVTLEGQYLEVNDAFINLFGYSREEILGRKASDMGQWVDPTDRLRYKRLLQTGERIYNQEYILQKKSGEWVTLLFSAESIQLQGRSCILSVAKEITERKQLETSLRQSEERNRAILTAIPDLMTLVSAEGIYLSAVRSNSLIDLVPPSVNPVGKHLAEMLPAEVAETQLRLIKQALATGDVQRVEQRIWIDDRWQYEELRVAPCGSDTALVIIRDISDRKQAELELIESRDLREAIFNGSADAIFLIELPPHSRILDCNQRAVELFEVVNKVELVGINSNTLKKYPLTSADLDEIASGMQQMGFWSQEIEYVTRTGRTFWGNLAIKQIQVANQATWLVRVTDITERARFEAERKQIESALQQSEQLFRGAFETSAFGISIRSPEGKYLRVNQALCRMLGYTEAELLQASYRDITHPEDLAINLENTIHKLLAGDISYYHLEKRFIHKAGHVVWGLVSISLVRDLQQQPLYFVAQIQDITDRKQAQEALRQSEARFQKIAAASPAQIYILVCGADGSNLRFEYISPGVREIQELEPDQVLQDAMLTYLQVHPDDRAIYNEITYRSFKRLEPFSHEWRIIPPSGKVKWVQATSRPERRANGDIAWYGVLLEVTDRKQAEEALRQNERRFQRLAAAAPGAIYTLVKRLDESFYFEYVSPAIEEINECTVEQMLADPALTLIHPEDVAGYEVAVASSAITLQSFSYEFRIITPSGRLKWLQASSRPELRQNGEIAWYGIVLDISDRKRLELALQASESKLSDIINSPIAAISRIFIFADQHWEIDFLSAGCETVFGYTPQEMRDNKDLWMSRIEPADLAAFVLPLFAEIYTVQTLRTVTYEYRFHHKDGTLRWISCRFIARRDEANDCWVLNQLALDVSEAKRAEAERNRAEAALRQSEAALRRAQQVAHVGSWQVDAQTRKVTWTEESFHIMGWDMAQPEPTLSQFYELIHPDDRDLLRQSLEQALTDHKGYKVVFRVIHPDGSIHYVEARGEAIVNDQGQVTHLIGTNLDITEREQVAAALRHSEATKNQILKAIPDLIIWMNADGTCIDLIDGNEITNLYVKSEAIGRNLLNILPPPLAEARRNAIQQVLKHGEVQIYEQQILIKAEIRYEEVRVIGVGEDRILVIVRDITDRKRAEAALLDSETRFRSAFWDAPIGMALIGLDDRWIKVNPMLCEMLGFSETELLSMPASHLIHTDDLARFQHSIQQVRFNKNCNLQVELRYCCQQGHLVWGLMSLSLVRDAQNQPLYYVAQIQDITERRAIDRMKNEFISIVSHELRTPLTAIRGFLGLLDTGIYDNKPEKAKRMIGQALTNSDRLVRLVNDILDLERLSSGRVQLVMEVCGAEELMQRAVAGVQSIAEQASVTLTIDPTMAQVWADPETIIQTLTNLLSNAIKFSPPHSLIRLAAQPQADSVLFSVADQGRGIPADKLETIFGRFQQVDVSDARQKGGTGLGLAICQSIVQQHGGNIWAESIFGEGSTFYFTLPVPPGGDHD